MCGRLHIDPSALMPNPVLNPAILISPVEGGYVAYDPASDQLHQLNPTAALTVELCDGSREPSEIDRLIAPILPEGNAGEVERWIAGALKLGLLVADASGVKGRSFDAAELYQLAQRLKEHGKTQTTYRCLKRVVEMKPDHWDAWYDLGDAALNVGKRSEGRDAYQKYFEQNPDDAEIEHLLIALRDDAPPPRVSDRTIQCIYRDFADHYDTLMRDDLGYQGPERMHDAIKGVIGEARGLRILDLGCGSGLAGLRLKPFAGHLTGIDLSPEMLALAKARGLYDRLEVAEITDWLEHADERFDIIACCDCLIYFGDLHRIVGAAAKRLNEGGMFAMSMERGARYPFALTDTGRYQHHPDHVCDAAAEARLTVARLDEAFLRLEYGTPVTAIYAVLTARRA
jgi:predicted TPR repeat methyltransferase